MDPSTHQAVKPEISLKQHHAVIFDLDGVVTHTAHVHAKAWKRLFDDYLAKHAEKEGKPFVPFDEEKDYIKHVDGKPRYDGVRDFLKSRGIKLPRGKPDDSPDEETYCGLGNRKNIWFNEELDRMGAEVFQSTVDLIKELRAKRIKTGIISSSKNCTPILKKAGLLDLFDTKIDGVDSEKRGIVGKPAPDIFLMAAHELGVEPRHAVVVEDAVSGVEAGRAGRFGLVIGIDRTNQGDLLLQHGADVVVKDLEEVSIVEDLRTVPNAIDAFKKIQERIEGKTLAIFLDYDGTMTPIVEHPDLALLDRSMRRTLLQLIHLYNVAVITGRDRMDIQEKLQIEGICYAGSHGFDIAGPTGETFENPEVEKFVPSLEKAEIALREGLENIDGAFIERKRFSIATHYRRVAPERAHDVEDLVDRVHAQFPNLRKTFGKKVYELQPKMTWHKGKALRTLMHILHLDKPDVVPMYIGDDVTDEDAFHAIEDDGIGICVQEQPRDTAASYTLKDVDEVRLFFEQLIKLKS